jgi:hypothetical protein
MNLRRGRNPIAALMVAVLVAFALVGFTRSQPAEGARPHPWPFDVRSVGGHSTLMLATPTIVTPPHPVPLDFDAPGAREQLAAMEPCGPDVAALLAAELQAWESGEAQQRAIPHLFPCYFEGEPEDQLIR